MQPFDKIYQAFYKKPSHPSRTFINMLWGGVIGLVGWLLSLSFDKLFGLNTFYWYLSYFMTGGIVLGAIIGMISNEILWHKHYPNQHKKE